MRFFAGGGEVDSEGEASQLRTATRRGKSALKPLPRVFVASCRDSAKVSVSIVCCHSRETVAKGASSGSSSEAMRATISAGVLTMTLNRLMSSELYVTVGDGKVAGSKTGC